MLRVCHRVRSHRQNSSVTGCPEIGDQYVARLGAMLARHRKIDALIDKFRARNGPKSVMKLKCHKMFIFEPAEAPLSPVRSQLILIRENVEYWSKGFQMVVATYGRS